MVRPKLSIQVIGVFFFLRMLCLGAGEIFPNACVQQWFKRRRGRAVGVVPWSGVGTSESGHHRSLGVNIQSQTRLMGLPEMPIYIRHH